MTRDQLRAICHSLPGTTEDIKWGDDLMFSVGGKIYCGTSASGPEPIGLSMKTTPATFDLMTGQEGVTPAAYSARFHWITVAPDALADSAVEDLVRQAHEIVLSKLSKKKQREIRGE